MAIHDNKQKESIISKSKTEFKPSYFQTGNLIVASFDLIVASYYWTIKYPKSHDFTHVTKSSNKTSTKGL
jgi:hypothetical protein